MTTENDLPSLEIADAKRVLATSIGLRLEGIAEKLTDAIADLDQLRKAAGFVNGLGKTAAATKRELEATREKIRLEIADVKRALQEKPEPQTSVDEERVEEVRRQQQGGAA